MRPFLVTQAGPFVLQATIRTADGLRVLASVVDRHAKDIPGGYTLEFYRVAFG